MTKIEELASAIYRRAGERTGLADLQIPWAQQPEAIQQPWLDEARWTVEALRVPSADMLAIDRIEYTMPQAELPVTCDPATVDGVWRACIDAILAERPA